MAQRHPRDTPCSNPHGTAPHTPHARHARRPSSQPAIAFHGTAPHTRHARRSLPLRSKKRPLRPAPGSHPQIHGFPAAATISQRRTRECAHAHAICRTGPRNPAILATAHDSLHLPHKTMPSEATGRTAFPTPATRNARCVHASPRRPRESTFATPPATTPAT